MERTEAIDNRIWIFTYREKQGIADQRKKKITKQEGGEICRKSSIRGETGSREVRP